MKKYLVLIIVVLGFFLYARKAEPMAIDFSNASAQNISFGVTPASNLDQISIVVWMDLDSFGDTSTGAGMFTKGTHSFYVGTLNERLIYRDYFSGAAGTWATANNTVIAGERLFIVTFDRSSASNDPIFYIDGVASATSETDTPSGSKQDDAAYSLYIGGYTDGLPASTKSPDGKIRDFRIYNRILTPAEALQIYNARGRDNIRSGLVFCPIPFGATGLQAFDGATLAAGNTIIDPCSGTAGVPAGNPVGAGEIFLSVRP